MKQAIRVFLTAALLMPTYIYVQQSPDITTDLQSRKNAFRNISTKFNNKWNQYTKCITGNCSPQEKSERWEEVQSTAWTAIKIGVALILVIAGIRKIAKKIQKKRKTLKIE